jgi:hypothetical protein
VNGGQSFQKQARSGYVAQANFPTLKPLKVRFKAWIGMRSLLNPNKLSQTAAIKSL